MLQFSREAARQMLLAAQGLQTAPAAPATKADVLATIRRMGVLQIDTINVVARSPYLVLWSRLGAYEPRWLDELLREGAIFEHWSHEACFLPMELYPLQRRLMLDHRKGWRSSQEWLAAHPEDVQAVMSHIHTHGSGRSADFARTDGAQSGWWNWKIEKQTLEHLLNVGELMVAERHNFQRIYAPRAQVLPDWRDDDAPPYAEVQRVQTLQAVRALGVTVASWVPDYFRMPKAATVALVGKLAHESHLIEARIADWAAPAYLHPDHLALAEAVLAGAVTSEVTTLLSPFDPIVWDRARASALFDFEYRIECYTPEAKRRYGYFSLPMLHRGMLIGRLDAKAHRKEGRFEVKTLHLEPSVTITKELVHDLAGALRRCATWHQTPEILLGATMPTALGKRLQTALRRG
jgi:uncharacterized protein YcaQ